MQTSSEVYIVTEEFGIDLDRWQLQLKQKLSLLPSEYLQNIRGVTRQLLRAIHDLHSVGVVHRDIKLHNVLIRAGEVKLIDFGAATIVSEDMALQSPVIRLPIKGTLGYLAPEVLAQASTHVFECHLAELPALDMFALGAVVYQLLYGRAPFRVSDLADIAKGQPDPFAVKSSALLQRMVRSPPYYPRGLGNIVVDADAKEFVMNLLRLDPKERWTSAQALASPWMTKNIEL
jgi:serine/threonine protein kinase